MMIPFSNFDYQQKRHATVDFFDEVLMSIPAIILESDLKNMAAQDLQAADEMSYIMSNNKGYKYYCGYYNNSDLTSVVLKNCMLAGCGTQCAEHHGIESENEFEITELISPCDVYNPFVKEIQPYTPDSDHCYYASAVKTQDSLQDNEQPPSDTEDKMDILKNIPTPPSTSESPSESSSDDEVDVVTVPEEYQPPAVPQFEAEVPRRSTRSSRSVRKPPNTHTLSAKSLKAAMKRTRMQQQSISATRRPYRRRKINESIEITPDSSVTSSAHSSRCNSDTEDVDKRRTHNSSERKRREAQRTALQNLRICIPDLHNNAKAPKVLILNSATALVKKLEHNDRTLNELKLREMQRKSDLTAKLYHLRMQMKMSHTRLQ